MKALLVLACLLAAPALAQDAPAPAPAPAPRPGPGAEGGREGGPGEGGSGQGALAQLAPSLHVAGLTLENAELVSDELEDLVNTVYCCPACHGLSYSAGTCCERPREERKALALGSVAPNPSASTLSFVVSPGRCVRLSELEHALAAHHIEVLRERLHLSGRVTLELDGLPDEAAAHAVADALVAAKLFEELEVAPPMDGHVELVVRRPAPTPAPLLHVREVVAAAAPEAKVVDVIWAGLPAS